MINCSILSCAIRGEFSGWHKKEIIWLIFSIAVITAISIILEDTFLSFAAAVSGTLYTLIAGKGKRSCYLFGVINSVCYALMSFEYRLFGETALYGGYYLPMMFAGFYLWKKNLDAESTIVKTNLTGKWRYLLWVICIAATAFHAGILRMLDGRTPGLDSATNVLSIAAMILTVRRCIEQWILWIIVNGISILMWCLVWQESGEASAIVVMYIIWLISAVIFYFQWRSSCNSPVMPKQQYPGDCSCEKD